MMAKHWEPLNATRGKYTKRYTVLLAYDTLVGIGHYYCDEQKNESLRERRS